MKPLVKNPPVAPSAGGPSATRDTTQELAKLSGAAKAQLVMEYLGIPQDKLGGSSHKTPGRKTPPSKELLHRLLADLARDLGEPRAQKPQPAASPTRKDPTPARPFAAGQGAAPVRAFRKNPAPFLLGQHPSVAAILLSDLSTSDVAAILKRLPPKPAQRIALSIAGIETGKQPVPARALRIIRQASL